MSTTRVLIVGDDLALVQRLSTLCDTLLGLEVAVAGNGCDGLFRTTRDRPDLVLLDADPAGEGSVKTAEAVMADERTAAPLIAMIPPTDVELERRYARLGVRTILKNGDPEEWIPRTINAALTTLVGVAFDQAESDFRHARSRLAVPIYD